MRPLRTVLVYLAVAVAFTWPAVVSPVAAVPGGDRTDLWDSLWSLWYFGQRVFAGELPLRVDGLLNHPVGGTLWVADPVNAVLALPLLPLVGPAAAWTVLVLGHMTFAGFAAHKLGEAVSGPRAAWVTGISYAAAPILLAHVHNGASEAVGTGWLAWAALELWRLKEGGSLVRAGVALAICSVAHWYAGVCGFVLLVALALLRGPARRLAVAGAIAGALALPVAALAHHAATEEDNVVGIKNPRELRIVRRTIGAADPVAFVMPGDYRSPDFHELSRYGEEYVHCPYLGWVGLVLAAASLRKREGTAAFWLAGVTGAVLACGPVLCRFGSPVILPGRLAVPLPYLLLEKLPGFDSLSLTWRLAQLAALSVAVLAGRGTPPRFALPVALAMLAETRFVSPVRGLPETTDARLPEPVSVLAEAEPGAVMLFPVVGGRAYLYEQTGHHKPLCATLNFPNNGASKKVWTAILAHRDDPADALRREVEARARQVGVRYLLAHTDPMARPDMHDQAMRAVRANWTPIATGGGLQVYKLW